MLKLLTVTEGDGTSTRILTIATVAEKLKDYFLKQGLEFQICSTRKEIELPHDELVRKKYYLAEWQVFGKGLTDINV